MDNYEKMMESARCRFAGYDMDALAKKAGVTDEGGFLQTRFLHQTVMISKKTGHITVNGRPARFGESLSIYDWLCDRQPDAAASGEYCPVSSLDRVYVSGKGLGMQMPTLSKRIHEDPERFRRKMAALGARETELGDIGWQLDVFPDLPMCLKFYFGDEEFPPQLSLMWDKNSLQFVRYETLYYIAGCLHERLASL